MGASAETTLLASGGLIAGRYRPISELGRGASGRVVLAEDTAQRGVRRALKLVPRAQAERLRWEFERLRALSHPNLAAVDELLGVALAELGEGGAALVSEYVPGVDAKRAVRAVGLDPASRLRIALEIGCDVARALSAVHAQGLVHGDVKPDNIVVSEKRGAVLLDLGLCRRPGLEASLSGTPGYLAPELFAGELRLASDLFALGVTLAVLLGQEEPRARSATSLAATSDLPPVSTQAGLRDMAPAAMWVSTPELPASVPSDVADLVRSLVQLDPAARPVSAFDVAERLERLARQHGASPRADGPGLSRESATARAQRVLVLPHVDASQCSQALAEHLGTLGVVCVAGPPGSGRSRLVREAVATVQRQRLAAGVPAPSYQVGGNAPGSLMHDRIWHLDGRDAPTVSELQTVVAAAGLSGHGLTVVLESEALLEGVPSVTCEPLDDGGVRAILGAALPDARVTTALVEAARSVSGGLAGRLCRILSAGLAEGRELSRPTVLAAMVAGASTDEAVEGELARAGEPGQLWLERLALVGGRLPFAAVRASDAPIESLLTAGLVSRLSDGSLCLRPDVLAVLRSRLSPERATALLAELDRAHLSPFALAMTMRVQGEIPGALRAIADAMDAKRASGDPERAAQIADTCVAEVGLTLAAPAIGARWVDAERAAGRYAHACELADRLFPHTPEVAVVGAEVARLSGDTALAERWLAAVDRSALPEARAVEARLCFDRGHVEQADQLARALLATEPQGSSAALRALEVRALCEVTAGRADAAVTLLSGALAQRSLPVAVQARLWSVMGWTERVRGGARAALSAYRKAADAADQAGEHHAAATALVNLGNAQLDMGELGAAIWALREGARRLCLLGRDRDVWRALYNLAHARQLAGDIEGGVWMLERAVDGARRCGDRQGQALTASLGAELALSRGRLAEARAWLDGAVEDEAHPPGVRVVVAARAVEVAIGLDDGARAQAALRALEAVAGEEGSSNAKGELAIARLRVALAAPKGSEARAEAEAIALSSEHVVRDADSFDLRLRATLLAARAASEADDGPLAAARLGEARLMLDAAARSLPAEQRSLLRSAPAYRRALEAAPAMEVASSERNAASDQRLLALSKRMVVERRLPHLYERILDAAIDLTSAQQGYLVVRDREGAARVRAGRGLDQAALPMDAEAVSSSIVSRVMATGQPLTTTDAVTDVRLAQSNSVHALSLRSVLAVPLLSGGEVRGAIYLEDRVRPHAFGKHEVRLLSDLAALSVAALESAELLRKEHLSARRLAVARERLSRQVEAQALELQQLKRGQREMAGERFGIIGDSAPMRRVLELTERVSRSELPVLVLGESGTGKELLARAIHAQSDRADGPFVSENCSAIPEALLESALFGHVRGAFTGADRTRQGLFEVADGGTLFLDEVGDMSPAMQVRLLRVLQDGVVRPLGGDRERKVNVRVVAATHRDLEVMVRQGTFREDLYYRLAVVSLRLPALRERPADVGPLVAHFVQRYAAGRDVRIDRRALSRLSQYAWPGNVRQLENEVRRALLLADDCIGEEQLSSALLGQSSAPVDELDLKARVDDLERRLIRQAMDEANGNQTRAAKRLGVSRYGLQKMIKRLEL